MILSLVTDFTNPARRGNFPAGFTISDSETAAFWKVTGADGTRYNVSKKTGYIVNGPCRFPNKAGAKFAAADWEPA